MRLVASMIFTALCLPAVAAELTPADVTTMLQQQDATVVVQALEHGDSSRNVWLTVLDHIAAGESDWLALVPALAPAVLTILGNGLYSVDGICLSKEIEPPIEETLGFLDAAIPAVAAVLDPAVRPVRNDCLLQLGAERVAALVPPY
jgi:hypothetical protein